MLGRAAAMARLTAMCRAAMCLTAMCRATAGRATACLTAVCLAAVCLSGCSGVGPIRPQLAPAPSPPLLTPALTVTRIDRSGASQRMSVSPDGEWVFTPQPDSAWARVVNYGRLEPAQHERLAALLRSPELSGTATSAAVPCPAGYRYRLEATAVAVAWTDCDADGQPVLATLLALLTAAQPAF